MACAITALLNACETGECQPVEDGERKSEPKGGGVDASRGHRILARGCTPRRSLFLHGGGRGSGGARERQGEGLLLLLLQQLLDTL